jgi:hypothetical protein
MRHVGNVEDHQPAVDIAEIGSNSLETVGDIMARASVRFPENIA